MKFDKLLEEGKKGESLIANWLKTKGFNLLPVYEIEKGQYKGPSFYTATNEEIIAPDLLGFKGQKTIWFEAKHKDAFTWYRKKGVWNTGIDKRHFNEYKKLLEIISFPIWLLFLHKGGKAIDSPESPSGLYGNSLDVLKDKVCHYSDNWGLSGMVYWDIKNLKKFATYQNLINL